MQEARQTGKLLTKKHLEISIALLAIYSALCSLRHLMRHNLSCKKGRANIAPKIQSCRYAITGSLVSMTNNPPSDNHE